MDGPLLKVPQPSLAILHKFVYRVIVDARLLILHFSSSLITPPWILQTPHFWFALLSSHSSFFIFHLSLRTVQFSLMTFRCSLLTSYLFTLNTYTLSTSHSILIAHFSQFTLHSHFSLLHSSCLQFPFSQLIDQNSVNSDYSSYSLSTPQCSCLTASHSSIVTLHLFTACPH